MTYRLTRWSDARHFYKRIAINVPQSEPLEYVEKVAKFTFDDFRRMLAGEGLAIDETYGTYDLAPYDAERSPRLILVARKRLASCLTALGSRQTLANAA